MKSRAVLALTLSLCVAGCATTTVSPPPISVEKSADAFSARSLRDTSLHRFLAENLGRDPGDAWDFEALTWAAFYFHPALELARAHWKTARASEQVARVRPNPTLTLTPGYNFTREPGLSPWMPAVNLDFLFPATNKRQLQQTIAQRDTEAAQLSVFTTAWQVRSDLRRALADTALAGRRESALRTQSDVQRTVLSLLEARRKAGSIAATEVSTARTALLRAQAAAADASSQQLTARARAAAALGLPLAALEGVTLPSPPAAPTLSKDAFATARRETLHTRADILAALAKYHSAHAALELELAKRVPDFHLGPGYQWDQGANKWTLALALELPLFHRNEAPIAEANARRAEAAAQFNVAQAQVIAEIDLASAARDAARLQLENARQLRAEIQQQAHRVRQRLDLGGADQVEVRTSQLDLATAETAVIEAENAAALADGQLEDALQLPFPHLAALADSTRTQSVRTP